MGAYRIVAGVDGSVLVKGKRIEQFTVMTDFNNDNARRRFADVLDRVGIRKGIRRARGDRDVPVYIGNVRVDDWL
jgi:Obg family GTPase CgtA-like protein